MKAERRHQNPPAIAVVSRVDDLLQAGGYVYAALDVSRAVCFDNILATVAEASIAKQKAQRAQQPAGMVNGNSG